MLHVKDIWWLVVLIPMEVLHLSVCALKNVIKKIKSKISLREISLYIYLKALFSSSPRRLPYNCWWFWNIPESKAWCVLLCFTCTTVWLFFAFQSFTRKRSLTLTVSDQCDYILPLSPISKSWPRFDVTHLDDLQGNDLSF